MKTHAQDLARSVALGLLAVSLLLPSPAQAVELDFGMTGGFEHYVSNGLRSIEPDRLQPTGGPNVGVWFMPWLGAGLSYRFVGLGEVDWDVNNHLVEASLRARFCLTEWLHVVTELGLELQVARMRLELGGLDAHQTSFAVGVQPRAGLEVSLPVDGSFELRAGAMLGFAFRSGLSFDDLVVPKAGSGYGDSDDYQGPDYQVRSIDAGTLNLSALTFGVTLGGRF